MDIEKSTVVMPPKPSGKWEMRNEMTQRVNVPIIEFDYLSSSPWDPHRGREGRMDPCKVVSDLQEPNTLKHAKVINKSIMKN